MSHHYPSMCQTVCEGAAAHRRPANWFDTGEKWCMIVLVNPSLSGCQMVWAWGQCDHIRPWFLHSVGFHPGVSISVPSAFPMLMAAVPQLLICTRINGENLKTAVAQSHPNLWMQWNHLWQQNKEPEERWHRSDGGGGGGVTIWPLLTSPRAVAALDWHYMRCLHKDCCKNDTQTGKAPMNKRLKLKIYQQSTYCWVVHRLRGGLHTCGCCHVWMQNARLLR